MLISIKTSLAEVQKRMDELQSNVRTKATVSAVNKTMEQARTQMVREITSEYALKAGYVRDRLRIRRASFKQGAFSVEASLAGGDGKRRSANVMAFGARQVRKGVSVKIKKAGGRQIITGAFIANQGRTVFQRVGSKRLPIKPVRTIDVPSMFNQKRINSAVVAAITDKFPAIFEREARFYVARFNRGG